MIPTFVINLAQDTERRAHIQRQLDNLPDLQPTFVEAVHGLSLADAVCALLADSAYWAPFKGTIGCFLSHVRAWEMVAREAADFALVLEDDADLAPLRAISSLLLPDEFDILFVNERMSLHGATSQRVAPILSALRLMKGPQIGFGADGYLLTPGGARKLLAACRNDLYFGHVDGRLVRYATTENDLGELGANSLVGGIIRHHHHKERLPALGLLKGYVLAVPLVKHRGVRSTRQATDDTASAAPAAANEQSGSEPLSVVLEIKPVGRLANRMIQYLAARKLQSACPGLIISNPNLPEFGFIEANRENQVANPAFTFRQGHPRAFTELAAIAKSGTYARIILDDPMQQMDLLPDNNASSEIFPIDHEFSVIDDDELLINIRAEELTSGIWHYPLVPIDFYQLVLTQTNLRPVFMGQIDQSEYCKALKLRFAGARFIATKGPLHDFQTIRNAGHIVVAVSTFSWLAAWLSNAKLIIVPVLGLFNPVHFRDRRIDLLPLGDARYRFFKFPLHYGVPEQQAIKIHPELTGLCREILARDVALLQTMPARVDLSHDIDFDEVWYTHNNLDAALEISEGWFAGPLEHYQQVGSRRHYRPMPEAFSYRSLQDHANLVDHALGKPARQSSRSQWSAGRTVEEDAARALQGSACSPFAFHTSYESNPWWDVDLGHECLVSHLEITNRSDNYATAVRATPLSAHVSVQGDFWSLLFITPDSLVFGADTRPLIWTAPAGIKFRFLRLSVNRPTYLHLRQVRILGPAQS